MSRSPQFVPLLAGWSELRASAGELQPQPSRGSRDATLRPPCPTSPRRSRHRRCHPPPLACPAAALPRSCPSHVVVHARRTVSARLVLRDFRHGPALHFACPLQRRRDVAHACFCEYMCAIGPSRPLTASSQLVIAIVIIGPWAALLVYDLVLYVVRSIAYEIPVVGGRARGKARPRAPSLAERPSGHRRRFSIARPAAQATGGGLRSEPPDPRWRRIKEEADEDSSSASTAWE